MATRHVFEPRKYHFTYGPNEPVLTLEPGDRLVTTTVDAFSRDAEGKKLARSKKHLVDGLAVSESNPLTGPFHVKGAEIGHTLAVHIEKIRINRDFGLSCIEPGFGGLAVENIPIEGFGPVGLSGPLPKRLFTWRFDPKRKVATLDLPKSTLARAEIPLDPFLGCLGTAPNLGQTLSSMTPGQHGGNMDCVETRQGSTVYLPVYARGAYLAFGDVHAVQGDGETCGAAVETTAEVTLRVELIKDKPINWPRIEDGSHIMVAASARPLIDAFKIAHSEMVRWLASDYGFDTWEVYQLLTQVGTARIGSIVNPKFTVVAKYPKKYLP